MVGFHYKYKFNKQGKIYRDSPESQMDPISSDGIYCACLFSSVHMYVVACISMCISMYSMYLVVCIVEKVNF